MEGPADDSGPHPDVLVNENPSFVGDLMSAVVIFLQYYGWFIVFGVIGIAFVYKKLEPKLQEWKRKQQMSRDYTNYDPEVTRQRQEAMERARSRMQEQHVAKAEKFAEDQKKKDDLKRTAKIDDWNRHQEGRGYRSKVKSQEDEPTQGPSAANRSKKNVYRDTGYNPLTGGSGGSSYRPARRGGAGGGG